MKRIFLFAAVAFLAVTSFSSCELLGYLADYEEEISFAEGGAIVLSSRISKNIGSIETSSASVDETCGNPYIMPAAKPA
jgi:hypothetical protein